jgi:hypothetical protein
MRVTDAARSTHSDKLYSERVPVVNATLAIIAAQEYAYAVAVVCKPGASARMVPEQKTN